MTPRIRRAAIATFPASVVATVAILLPASPAAAANLDGTCDTNEFCLYDLPNFTPGIHDRSKSEIDTFSGLSWWGVGGFINNDTESLWNRKSVRRCLYEDTNQGGSSFCLNANSSAGSLGVMANAGSSYGA